MEVADYTVPIGELIDAVKGAIKAANISAASPDSAVRVGLVRLTMNAVATDQVGGGVDFRIPVIGWRLKAGVTRASQRTHTIEITLQPKGRAPRFEVRDQAVEEALVRAIDTIRFAINTAAGGDDPFALESGIIELVFGVTDKGTISVGAEAELRDEVTHKLRLELTPGD
ncbi:trypco2 family protein [Paractinoplanes toevensis]|nr:trypco2 family protein [Actinoplanes toevensis]